MLVDDDIAAIELKRLGELEKQAALFGPQTEPAVLVEIQDLRHRHGISAGRRVRTDRTRESLDYDFLMNTVAAALQRLTAVESHQTADGQKRGRRQMVLNIWLGAITAVVVFNTLLTLWFMSRLFGV
jgi:hypothetical protein